MGMKAMLASKEGIHVAGEAGNGEELFHLLQSTTAGEIWDSKPLIRNPNLYNLSNVITFVAK
jgi:hypothetical protein